MRGSIQVANIAGIRINIDFSWLIILVLLTVSLAAGWFPSTVPGLGIGIYYLLGFIAAILLFASVLVHELAHSLVARARGLPVSSISLFIFGGVSNLEREPQSPGVEFQMAIVGPVTSLIIGGISWLLALATGGISRPLTAILSYLAFANVLLGIFNLIPGFPLDGGRVLRSIIWKITGSLRKATRWAAIAGQGVAFLFIFWGILQVFTGNLLGGIWIGFIGWFLLMAAQSSDTQLMVESLLRGVQVKEVMTPVPASVSPTTTIQQLVNGYFLPLGLRAVPVVADEQLVGLITLREVRQVPQERWAQTPVSSSMIPASRLHVVSPQQSLSDVLPMMVNQDINQMPVVENGRLVGMISREAIVRYLEVRRNLGLDGGSGGGGGQRYTGGTPTPAREQDTARPREPV